MLATSRAISITLALALTPLSARSADDWYEDGPDDEASPELAQAEGPVLEGRLDPTALPPAAAPLPQQGAPVASATPPGQWVHTSQYGWVWMPYSDAYTSVPSDYEGEPYEYVYRPSIGWCWVAAPWIWGWGPWPYFGVGAAWQFGWYGHGWWRTPSRWHYAPGRGWAGGRGWNGGHGWNGNRGWNGGRGWSGGRAWTGRSMSSWSPPRLQAGHGGFPMPSRGTSGGRSSGGHGSGGHASGGHGGGGRR